MNTLAPGIDAADLVEDTYNALRAADDAEHEAKIALLTSARQYASCTKGSWLLDEAEEKLINLGDAAIELEHLRQTFETRQQEMKMLWRLVHVRSRKG